MANVDFAIEGETPLAWLLAGLLAGRHKRKVALVGSPGTRYRLARSIDISVAPVTRPETWALIRQNRDDVAKLIARIAGKAAMRRLDPLFFAETDAGRDALGHMQVMAAACGESVEPLPEGYIGMDAAAFRLRDARLIERPVLEAAFMPWLETLGVSRQYESAGMTILADDEAALARADALPALLAAAPTTALLTEPTPPLVSPLLLGIDRGMMLAQAVSGGVTAIAAGAPQAAMAQVGAVLARDRLVRRAGQASFRRLISLDGAPVIGSPGGGGPLLLCGLEPFGAFIAPAIARFFAGEASDAETAYFAARAASGRGAVADYRAEAGQ